MSETLRAENPARTLYDLWDTILKGYGHDTCGWGPRGWGVWRDECSGGIAYGQLHSVRWFDLLPDGRFRINGVMHGHYRRSCVAQGTFLGFGHTHSRYQWFVQPSPNEKHSGWRGAYKSSGRDVLTDWRTPISYISEDLMGVRTWNQWRPWLALAQAEDGDWEIIPVLHPDDLLLQQRWDHYKKLVARRRRIAENEYRVKNGHPRMMSARTPIIRSGGQVLSPDQSVRRLAALLEVTQPAKTTPLRPKEAVTHGADNLAAPLHA